MPKRPVRPKPPENREGPLPARTARGMIWVVVVAVVAMAAWTWWPGQLQPRTAPPAGSAAVATGGEVVPAREAILKPQTEVFSTYAGSASCRKCHEKESVAWEASHHALAERAPRDDLDGPAFEPPRTFTHGSQTTEVRLQDGVYEIVSTGLEGRRDPQVVDRVIGEDPLRQFLVAAPGGRWQTMEASWDTRTNVWFNVYGAEDRQPGEWGHWTGRGMNWNSMCGTCHNTRYRKNYDQGSDGFQSAMAERSVGCEACHGPMRDHVVWQEAWQDSGRTDPTLRPFTPAQHMETCAPCHARRSELTGELVPGESFWDHFLLAIVDQGNVFYPDGQIWDEDYEYTPFLGSRMHAAGVTCLDCHDVHAARPKMTGNALCLQCHNGSRVGSPVIDPVAHSFHQPDSTGNLCVNCHMPQTVYMQKHWRHDHGFTSPDPLLTHEFGIPNACNRCHADKDVEWAQAACEKWYGPRMERPARRRTRLMAAARRGDEASIPPLSELLKTPEVAYWKAAALAVLDRWVDRRPVAEAFLAQLAHEHPLVRYRAVQGLAPLAEAGDERVTRALRLRLDDASRAVRFCAAWALRREVAIESRPGAEMLHMLTLNADQPAGQAQWGAYEMARGHPELAESHYARAVAWDPGSPPFRHDYAVALSILGRAAEALEQCRAVVRLQPEVAENHYRLALAWNETGDLARAVESLEQAVRLDPRHDRALYNLGLAYQSLGRTEDALDALLRAQQARPDDPRIPYARATILVQASRIEEARIAVEEVLRLRPDYGPALQLQQVLGR